MHKVLQFIIIFFFALNNPALAEDNSRYSIRMLMDRLCQRTMASVNNDILLFDNNNAVFNDIDYSDRSRTYWKPIQHLERIRRFSEAYVCQGNMAFQSDTLHTIIVNALRYWCKRNPHSSNWWYDEIKVPLEIGQILINMRFGQKSVPVDLEQSLLKKMSEYIKDPTFYTGANRVDVATHLIYKACLADNEDDLKKAIKLITDPICYTLSEGIVIDNSFCQHGRQLYISAYGRTFLHKIVKCAFLLMDTRYAFPQEMIKLISDFARDTFFPTIRGKYTSYNVIGREISRKGALNTSSAAIEIAEMMKKMDIDHIKEYDIIINHLKGVIQSDSIKMSYHRHFFYTDYTLHSSSSYTIDLRMSSNRTLKCESVNDENLMGYFLSEGGYCMMIDGKEYENIFPVWDWSRIPGVTSPHLTQIPKLKSPMTYGSSDFAGGVSDSIYGATAYIYKDSLLHTTAKKSWFFFDDEIVCMGSDILSLSNYSVETTVNQCLDNRDSLLLYCSNDTIKQLSDCEELNLNNAAWVLSNHVGYLFPNKEKIIVSKGKKQGNWHQINKRYDNSVVEENVFHLGIDHGFMPKNDSYLYMIIPKIESVEELKEYVHKSDIEIACHSSSLHAVYDASIDVCQMIFFKAGSMLYKGLFIQVDQPCGLIIKKSFGLEGPVLHVADIRQSKVPIHIMITNKGKTRNYLCDFTNFGSYSGETKCISSN